MAENESLDTSEYTRYFALPASEATLALRRAFGVDTVLHLAHVRYLNPNSVTSIGLGTRLYAHPLIERPYLNSIIAQPQQPQEASSSVPTSHRSRPTANSPPPLASGSPATTPQPRILDSPALLDDASRALCQQFIASSSPHDSPAQSVRFHCDHPRQADSSQLLTEPFAPEEPATLPADTPSVTRYSPSESSDDDESARGSRAAGRTLNICHADREFVVKKTIGHCAYGLVWHADMANLHSGQKREVAIKALHKTTMLVARTRSRGQGQDQRDAIVDANLALERNMRNELHVLKKVTRSRSPFLSPLLYAFSKEKYFYFVMRKYLTDLRTLTHVNKHVSTKQKRTWAAEIVSGLDDLHSLGIVHRDIKPENIFISPSGHAVISDFGHAAYAGDDRGVEDLQMNAASGTPGFMAPEQIPQRCSGGYTFKVDMWAFGVTLMEIVLGDRWDSYACDRDMPSMSPEWLLDDVRERDPLAADLIGKCLDEDPNARPTWVEVKCHPFFRSVDWANLGPDTDDGFSFVPCVGPYAGEYTEPLADLRPFYKWSIDNPALAEEYWDHILEGRKQGRGIGALRVDYQCPGDVERDASHGETCMAHGCQH